MVSRRKGWPLLAGLVLGALLAFTNYHWDKIGVPQTWQVPANFLFFFWLFGMTAMAWLNEDFDGDVGPDFIACVVVPLYNEDPATFEAMLLSLDAQTRLPDRVHIVDDGSATRDCQRVFREWAKTTSIRAVYTYKKNAGKREAQAVAIRKCPSADVYVTIDSDTVLDERAIERGIAPFANPKVMGVAGLLLSLNYRKNLLTRLVDLGFVSSFLNGRAAWSRLRSLAVSCGGLAFYRGWVVRKYLDEYLSQTVFGAKAASGDDRILTNFAALEGWTIFQESSVGYTLLPENMSHLTRQRIRWWRSFFWGGIWLIRRFPPNRIIWWLVTWQFVSFVTYTLVLPTVIIVNPVLNRHLPLVFFGYMFGLAYIRSAKYLSVKRPDQSFGQQLVTYLLAPVSSLLHVFLCTILQYVGLATVKTTKWGTRQNGTIEVAR